MKRISLVIILVCFGLSSAAIVDRASAQQVHPDKPSLIPNTLNKKTLTKSDKQRLSREVLDSLFGKLHNAKSDKSAKRIAGAIWRIWSRSGSPTANLLLIQAARAMAAGEQHISISILSTIIDQYPDFTEAWNRRATAYYIANDYTKSLADIAQVLKREPRHFGALAGMGMIYQQQGKNKKALSAYRRALAIHPRLKNAKRAVKRLAHKIEQDI